MITDAEFNAWLKDPMAPRMMLMEVSVKSGGVETVRRMSRLGYTSGPTDVPPNAHYAPVLRTGVEVTEELPSDGDAQLSYGDLEVLNLNGAREAWLADVWTNRAIDCKFGHPAWALADFRRYFRGVASNIVRKDGQTLAVKLRDLMASLNSSMHEVVIGGTGTTKDQIRPLCFGECHNITPVLFDASLLKYMVHDGPIEEILEVRAGGLPVSFTKDLATGTFTLNASPVGNVTCDVQGDKFGGVFRYRVGGVVRRIITGYGKDGTRLTEADINSASFDAYELAHGQPVGVYLKDRVNVLNVIRDITRSLSSHVVPGNDGKLRIVQLTMNGPSVLTMRESDIVEDTFQPAGNVNAVGAVNMGYCKNWTVQTDLLGGVPSDHRELYALEWQNVTPFDQIILDNLKLDPAPAIRESMLIDYDDALAEGQRRLQVEKAGREIFTLECYASMMQLQLGDCFTLVHRKNGFNAGKLVTVLGKAVNPDNFHVRLKILV